MAENETPKDTETPKEPKTDTSKDTETKSDEKATKVTVEDIRKLIDDRQRDIDSRFDTIMGQLEKLTKTDDKDKDKESDKKPDPDDNPDDPNDDIDQFEDLI